MTLMISQYNTIKLNRYILNNVVKQRSVDIKRHGRGKCLSPNILISIYSSLVGSIDFSNNIPITH